MTNKHCILFVIRGSMFMFLCHIMPAEKKGKQIIYDKDKY